VDGSSSLAGSEVPADLLEISKDWAENDYKIQIDLDSRSALERARDNVAAIELLKVLHGESRAPTEAEKDALTLFSGWGDSTLANTLFSDREYSGSWRTLRTRLKELLTPAEYNAAMLSTQYAHYTSAEAIEGMYAVVEQLGFKGVGRVLEAGAGVGRFRGLMPDEMRKRTHYTAVENDPIAGAICKALYASSDVRVEDFVSSHLPQNYYDLIVGNVPFSSTTIREDPEYASLGLSTHDYFLCKLIDRLRPGGIMVCLTSRYTLDRAKSDPRGWMASRANLLGAIRLPSNAFERSAGTQVVTDILVLQKRAPREAPSSETWLETLPALVDGKVSETHYTNEYYSRRPEQVLGMPTAQGRGLYGRNEYSVVWQDNLSFREALFDAANRMPADAYRPRTSAMTMVEEIERVEIADRHRKEGRYLLHEDRLFRVIDGQGAPVAITRTEGEAAGARHCLAQRKVEIMRDYIPLRDAREALLQAQLSLEPTDDRWRVQLAAMSQAYDKFVAKWGHLHKSTANGAQPNLSAISGDPEAYAVAAIEKYDAKTRKVVKAQIFSERVMLPPVQAVVVSASDALAWSLNSFAMVNIDAMAAKIKVAPAALMDELGEAIFEDPRSQRWLTQDDYLSGEVVQKLSDARRAAKEDPLRFARNVDALEAVQPVPLTPVDIKTRLGSAWIPAKDVGHFAREVLGLRGAGWAYDAVIAKWDIASNNWEEESHWERLGLGGYADSHKFATARMKARDIFLATLNQASIRVMDKVYRDGKEVDVINPTETEAANAKSMEMTEAWNEWVWKDEDRADRLCAIYNKIFNNTVPRTYNGDHLTFPGMNPKYEFRTWQKRAVWRGLAGSGDTYFGHAVGAGKTLEACALVITEKRLGMTQRPMISVPNHMLQQVTSEFLDVFPSANLLVADEESFTKNRRREFLGRIQASPWDGIIITHSAFAKIQVSPETQAKFIADEIETYKSWMAANDASSYSKRVKAVAKKVEKLERRMTELLSRSGKDSAIYFEDLGVDRLVVDEGHNFRKLDFHTEKRGLRGIDPNGSARALDLYMKKRYLDSVRPGRSLVMMSGTPLTNTMGEAYTIFKMLAPHILERQGCTHFDQWASVFGECVTNLEQLPSGGYAPATRFARFVNLPEMINAFREVVDIVRPSDMLGIIKVPIVKTGGRQIVLAEPSDEFVAYQKALGKRIDAITARSGKPKKGDDILLSVITDGIFSAIDERFFKADMPPNPGNKLNLAIARIAEVYHRTSPMAFKDTEGNPSPVLGASQMVFMDRRKRSNRPFDAYDWMRDELVRLGVPAGEIAFITDYARDEKKEVVDALNAGQKRILIGSTAAMGEGTNGQYRLFAEHHLDCPWYPAAILQREGRIVRQLNQNDIVEIYAYATRGSYDATMWQINECKAKFLDQALSSGTTQRSMSDLDSSADSFGLAKAMATGDPRILVKVGLEQDLRGLDRQLVAHQAQQMVLRSDRRTSIATIEEADLKVPLWKGVITTRETMEPLLQVGKQTIEHDKAAKTFFKAAWALNNSDRPPGTYRLGQVGAFGVRIWVGEKAGLARLSDRPRLWVDFGAGLDGTELTIRKDEHGAEVLLRDILAQVAKEPERALGVLEARQKRAVAELGMIEASLGAPFPYADEITHKRQQLREIDAELIADSAKDRAAAEAAAAGAGDAENDEDVDFEMDDEEDDGHYDQMMQS